MKLIKGILGCGYIALLSYVFWLFFLWITPFIMSLSWGYIVLYIFIGTAIVGLFASIGAWISYPLIWLNKDGWGFFKIIGSLIVLLFLFSSISMVWKYISEYSFKVIIISVVFTINIIAFYLTPIYCSWTNEKAI